MEDSYRLLAYINRRHQVLLYPENTALKYPYMLRDLARVPHLDEPLETYHQRLLDAKLKAVL